MKLPISAAVDPKILRAFNFRRRITICISFLSDFITATKHIGTASQVSFLSLVTKNMMLDFNIR